jgi:hypothetical protein
MSEEDKSDEERRLQEQVKEPFRSPEEAGMRMATVLARMFEMAATRFLRVHLTHADNPGAKQYWQTYGTIVDSGLKIITALQTAYKWDETIKRLRLALEEIRRLKEAGFISEEQYQEALAKSQEMEEAANG